MLNYVLGGKAVVFFTGLLQYLAKNMALLVQNVSAILRLKKEKKTSDGH